MFPMHCKVALNHEEIENNCKEYQNLSLFINKYNWKGTSYPSGKNDWKKIEKHNLTIVLNVLYAKNEKIYPAYLSKNNPKTPESMKSKSFFLISPNGEGWNYLALQKYQHY